MTFPFPYRPLRESISFKLHEKHIMDTRDKLCEHYRLNKSDLIKYLIKKEELTLRKPDGLLEINWWKNHYFLMLLNTRCFLRFLNSNEWNPINISRNLFKINMKRSSDKNPKDKTLSKILFLEDQLVSLDHYLPETYEYLMQELDLQKRNLAEIEIEEHFASIDANE